MDFSFKKILFVFFIFIFLLNIFSYFVNAQDAQNTETQEEIFVHFAYYDGCPYCSIQKEFMDSWKDKYPSVKIISYDVYNTQQNQEFNELAQQYGFSPRGVPVTIIDDKYWQGFTVALGQEMEQKIQSLLGEEIPVSPDKEVVVTLFYHSRCESCTGILEFFDELKEDHSYLVLNAHDVFIEEEEKIFEEYKKKYAIYEENYPIVFIGNTYYIGLDKIQNNIEEKIIECYNDGCDAPETAVELIWTTVFISFADGFNPCSIWLLVFLLGIVIYTGSRKKMLIIGLTFLFVTAFCYGLFIYGILNILNYVQHLNFVRIIIVLLALVFAIVNIKDFFWYKKGISFTVSDKQKPKIYDRIRKIMDPKNSFKATILGTIILAIGVTVVELPCTISFPIMWSGIVASSGVGGVGHFLLLLLYLLVYLSVEIVILVTAIITLKVFKFDQKHGRILKLIGGTIMIGLAYLLFFDIVGFGEMLLVFALATVLSLLVSKIYFTFHGDIQYTDVKEEKNNKNKKKQENQKQDEDKNIEEKTE